MASTKGNDDVEAMKAEHAASRNAVIQAEQEIQAIRVALRRVQADAASQEGDENVLEIHLLKVEGLPDTAKPKITLQLSSPIEEATLTRLFDPLKTESDSKPEKDYVAKFNGVDTSVATLTVSAFDADIPLGSSISYDISQICGIPSDITSVSDILDKYASDFPIAILDAESAAAAESKDRSDAKQQNEDSDNKNDSSGDASPPVDVTAEPSEKDDDQAASDTAETNGSKTDGSGSSGKEDADTRTGTEPKTSDQIVTPICTVTLRVSFKPTAKEVKDKIVEYLNAVSKKKAKALESLRRVSTVLAQQSSGGSGSSTAVTPAGKPTVKPGFLTRSGKPDKKSQLQQLRERFFGPQSYIMKTAGFLMFTRNYIIFFGATAFFHFKGHMLALPPPV